MIYADQDITIDRDGIRMPNGETEFIPLDALRKVEVTREKVGDHTRAAVGFLMLGILSFWFWIGWLFIAWGIAALVVKKYRYRVVITALSGPYVIMEGTRKGPVMSLCRTIEGLITARRLMTAS